MTIFFWLGVLIVAAIFAPIVYGVSRLYVRWQYRAAERSSALAREGLSFLASLAMFLTGMVPLVFLLALAGMPQDQTPLQFLGVVFGWVAAVAPGFVHMCRHGNAIWLRFNPELVQRVRQSSSEPPADAVGPDGTAVWLVGAGLYSIALGLPLFLVVLGTGGSLRMALGMAMLAVGGLLVAAMVQHRANQRMLALARQQDPPTKPNG